MDLCQIVYFSQPFGYDSVTLNGILLDARRCNKRDDVTGALICRHDIFLQLLEGPKPNVVATLERIGRDDRHSGLRTLVNRPIESRLFGQWSMLHDPAKSWIWSEEELADDVLDRAKEPEIIGLFEELSNTA